MQNSFSNIPNQGTRGEAPPFSENAREIHPDQAWQEQSRQEITYAGFWVRLGAYMIDSVVVFAGLLIVRFIMLIGTSVVDSSLLSGRILFQYTLKDIVLYSVQVLYFILCTYYTGTTLGKRAMNLRVIHTDESRKLTFLNVLYRETVGRFLSSIILGIGYIMIGFDKEKKGLHDILCDTRVVYGRKVKVYPVYQRPVQPYQPVHPQRPAAPRTNIPPITNTASPGPVPPAGEHDEKDVPS